MVLCASRPRCTSINDEKHIMHNNAGRHNDERDMNHQAFEGHTTKGKAITVIRMWWWIRRSRQGALSRQLDAWTTVHNSTKYAVRTFQADNDRMHKEDGDLFHDYDQLTNQYTNQIKGVRDRVQTMDAEGADLVDAYHALIDQYNDMYDDLHRLREEGKTLYAGTGEPNYAQDEEQEQDDEQEWHREDKNTKRREHTWCRGLCAGIRVACPMWAPHPCG